MPLQNPMVASISINDTMSIYTRRQHLMQPGDTCRFLQINRIPYQHLHTFRVVPLGICF